MSDGWRNGNHLAVAHRCERCGTVKYRLYEGHEVEREHLDNYQSLRPPDGWERHFGTLLCPTCSESFMRWYHGKETE